MCQMIGSSYVPEASVVGICTQITAIQRSRYECVPNGKPNSLRLLVRDRLRYPKVQYPTQSMPRIAVQSNNINLLAILVI